MDVEHPHDPSAAGSGCPDAEDLAAYLEGTVDPASRDAVDAHLADCARCRAALVETTSFMEEETPAAAPVDAPRVVPFRRPAWRAPLTAVLTAAAALFLVARLAPQWLPWGGAQPELQELMAALAKEPTRPVDGRLAGGFAYAPPPVTRGSSTREMSPEVRIAAGNLQSRAANDARGREAQGLAHLVSGNVGGAIAALEAAAAQDQGRAEIEANLAAAYLAQADVTGSRQDLSKALDAADRALGRNPALPAGLFNRALALERLGDSRATAAWQAALQAESDPAWRGEVTRRLRR